MAPPYRALAVRKDEGRWAVAARRITVAEFKAVGDEIELARRGDERSLLVDGSRGFGTIPELEELADGDAAIRATRLDGDLWEIRIDPLYSQLATLGPWPSSSAPSNEFSASAKAAG